MTNEENSNCLEGIECPKCGSLGPFKIQVQGWALVSDDGSDDVRELEWDAESAIWCPNCYQRGTVAEFSHRFHHVCYNCCLIYADSAFQQMVVHKWPDIPDVLSRLDVGGQVPSGECPECGALMYKEPGLYGYPRQCPAEQSPCTAVRKGNEEAACISE